QPELAFERSFGTTDYRAFERACVEYIQELEPNPEKTAEQRLQFLGSGLRTLHQRGVEVGTINELKAELRKIKYNTTQYVGHGLTLKMNSSDDSLFTPPPPANKRGKSSLNLIPSRNKKLPPDLRVLGLNLDVHLQWAASEEPDGPPVGNIVFKR
ncbi:MAG: hypothetical protein ACYTGQ_17190, partial [Planctomycetota bacterium]